MCASGSLALSAWSKRARQRPGEIVALSCGIRCPCLKRWVRSLIYRAVRIHRVRKTSTGAEVDLKGILDAIDNSFLTQVGKSIENKDTAGFKTAYRQTLTGCYACHTACEKPYLRHA